MEPVNDRSNADKGRRARLRGLAKKDFPGGKIPDPYTAAWLNLIGGTEMRDLPFIQATIRISPYGHPRTSTDVPGYLGALGHWGTGQPDLKHPAP